MEEAQTGKKEYRTVMTDHFSSLLLIGIGLLIIAASMPVGKVLVRNSAVSAQLSDGFVAWLSRIFGVLLSILGIVTLIQH